MIEMMLVLSLAIAAGVVSVVFKKRPDIRQAAAAGWRAGWEQTRIEFTAGYAQVRTQYERAQTHLRGQDDVASKILSGLLALLAGFSMTVGGALYGGGQTMLAVGRIVTTTVQAVRDGYADARADVVAADEVAETVKDDAEIVEAVEAVEVLPTPAAAAHGPGPDPPAGPASAQLATIPSTPSTEGTSPMSDTIASEAANLAALRQIFLTAAENLTHDISALDGINAGMAAKLAEHGNILNDIRVLKDTLATARHRANEIAVEIAVLRG
ncbi:hypothetical protein [Nonomuraea sp. CA-141351]|uniref:hypothetical protein n=1 Tax=Nonomuraea sp. CA-141351 TaxID=3239996 RepID=UPI003D91AF1A